MQQRDPRQVAHEMVLFAIIVSAIVAGMFGYFFASANANQRCKDAWERYEKENQRGNLTASSQTAAR